MSLRIGDNAIDDTLNGFFKDTNEQIEMVCKQIAEDPELQNGYNALGLSQVCFFFKEAVFEYFV